MSRASLLVLIHRELAADLLRHLPIQSLAATRSMHLVGHSFGALVALEQQAPAAVWPMMPWANDQRGIVALSSPLTTQRQESQTLGCKG